MERIHRVQVYGLLTGEQPAPGLMTFILESAPIIDPASGDHLCGPTGTMKVTLVTKNGLHPDLQWHAEVAPRGSWGNRSRGGSSGDEATWRPPRCWM